MSHDEKTDPQMKAFSSAPPTPLTPAQQHALQTDVGLIGAEVRNLRRCFIDDDGNAICHLPAARCAALNMAETASIGVAELHGMRNRDARIIAMVTGAAALVASVIGVLGAAALTRQAEAAVERKTPEIVEISMQKYQKSTEAIAFESARAGAEFALKEFQRTQAAPPIARKPAPP